MSESSGGSQVISLPRGGGALSGIGEKFSPDLHTGTGNFTVPIALPPGRGGFEPELNLVYSSGSGTGAFGLGWSLSVPGVSRKTSSGVPRYDDGRDVFVLSGAEDLVPIEVQETRTRYQPRTEGLFARVLHHRSPDSDYWEVRSKNGFVSRYGTEAAVGTAPAVISDPTDGSHVFAWKLTETRDPFGNRILYEYDRDLVVGDRSWDQIYLRRIRYVDHTAGSGAERFLVSVTFEYEELPDRYDPEVPAERRVYPFSEYRSGFEIRTRRRCNRILTRTHPDGEGEGVLVRSYALTYLDERIDEVASSVLPRNGISLLSRVTVTGHDESQSEPERRSERLPSLEFGYTRFEPERRDLSPLEGSLPTRSLAGPHMELADLFGNGLPDLLEMNGSVRYWRNLGGGEFDLPRPMRDAPAGLTLADPGVQLIDADGDGRLDLLSTANGLAGYFPLSYDGSWDRRSFRRYNLAPSFDLQDPEVHLVDLDGDGVTDAVRSGTRLECYFNDPQEGWNGTRHVERGALHAFPNVSFSDPRVRWADMTGDGLQDILLVHDGNIEYWPSLGHGDWGRRIHMRNSPRFPYGYDRKRILIGDVDGDGLADLVYVDHGRVLLWINQSGCGWSDPVEVDGTPPVADMDAVRLVDVMGTGISGVLWSADARAPGRPHLHFLDFTGGRKPYLLDEMDSHMGAVTRVEYAPSTRFYLSDQRDPSTRWRTPLPFPVHVVTRVEVIDELSRGKLSTEYRYHDGYWDGAEREFRGFGMVERLDTETFERYSAPGLHAAATHFLGVDGAHFSPPSMTRTWIHQGPVGPEHGDWRELDYSHAYWPGDLPQLLATPGLAALLADASLPRPDKRDALRALRGSILRTELYSLDGSSREDRPHTVTESLYDVREESPPAPGQVDRKRVFFPHLVAQRTTQWERGDDPMTSFSFTGDYEAYGLPRTRTSLAVPRGRDFRVATAPGESYLGTHRTTRYAHQDDEDHYLIGRIAVSTTQEIVNDGSPALFDLLESVRGGEAALRVIDQTLNFYDGEAFTGLSLGQVGDFGTLVRSESLVLTEEILHDAYRSGGAVLDPPERPPYLDPAGVTAWTEDYPQPFRDELPALAGYTFRVGDDDGARGYFAETTCHRYDFHDDPMTARGLPLVLRDPLGRDTSIVYDTFALLPVTVTGPTGLTIEARYDYRVLQPDLLTDPNGNREAFAFTPLGLLERRAVMGKEGEDLGDTLDAPGTRLTYDFLAFNERGQPISVRKLVREHHVHDTDVPLPDREATTETVEYSDGFGRLLQTRTQAENVLFGDLVFANDANLPLEQAQPGGTAVGQQPGPDAPPRVVISGWQIYDNKGQVIEKYEPFFSRGFDYALPLEAEMGQRVTMFYDARGQVVRTVSPNGSEQRVIYGVPADLTDPDIFTVTPWEVYTYDANDNAGRTHPGEAHSYQDHWNTPHSALIDALGRTVEVVVRNGLASTTDWFVTRSVYDVAGNLLSVTDAFGRSAIRYVYDMAGITLRTDSIDAGLRRTVLDAVGNPVEQRDGKGALLLSTYDDRNRPTHLWARDGVGQPLTLRQHLIYGDSQDVALPTAESRSRNLLGRLVAHYDEGGRLTAGAYDFKGSLREKTRRVIRDDAILSVFAAPSIDFLVDAFRVDWQPAPGVTLDDHADLLLDPFEYTTTTVYDALNRARRIRYPEDVEGRRRELVPRYDRAGGLQSVTLDGEAFVEHIAYNAKKQRTLIAYGNRMMTRYSYDPLTFRLRRLRSERFERLAEHTYEPSGAPLQDFAYEHDLAANITAIHDRTPGGGVPGTPLGPNALDRVFSYDPIYRLVSATGRECDRPPPAPPWDHAARCQDSTLTRAYTETYRYDRLGNMERLRHLAGSGSFTRSFTLAPGNNRLATMTVGSTGIAYSHDASGNLVGETTSRHFEWDHSDRLKVYRTQPEGAGPSLHAQYLYDATGQRVKKLVRGQGGQVDVTVYIDGLFEHHRRVEPGNVQANNTLQILDDLQRIAMVRIGSSFPEDTTPATSFHLGDHLGSSNVVVDGAGAFVNREEYTPYGETSFGAFARKRYRFTAKERDEESGLSYHGARYYACWLGRWTTVDPTGFGDSPNLYAYVLGNPVRAIDPRGTTTSDVATPGDDGATCGRPLDEVRTHGTVRGEGPAKRFVFDQESEKSRRLAELYPHGVPVRTATKVTQGREVTYVVPIFDNLVDVKGNKAVRETYKIEGGFKPGEGKAEIARANAAFKERYGYSVGELEGAWRWHHSADLRTLQLIDADLHSAIGHHGGSFWARINRFTTSAAEVVRDLPTRITTPEPPSGVRIRSEAGGPTTKATTGSYGVKFGVAATGFVLGGLGLIDTANDAATVAELYLLVLTRTRTLENFWNRVSAEERGGRSVRPIGQGGAIE
jgi:RHS repeat-associated protein